MNNGITGAGSGNNPIVNNASAQRKADENQQQQDQQSVRAQAQIQNPNSGRPSQQTVNALVANLNIKTLAKDESAQSGKLTFDLAALDCAKEDGLHNSTLGGLQAMASAYQQNTQDLIQKELGGLNLSGSLSQKLAAMVQDRLA